MTLKEFFRKARRGRKWHTHGGVHMNQVRCADNKCPIAAVARSFNVLAVDDAKDLGLRVNVARRIIDASDFPDHPSRPWLLKQLGVRGTP